MADFRRRFNQGDRLGLRARGELRFWDVNPNAIPVSGILRGPSPDGPHLGRVSSNRGRTIIGAGTGRVDQEEREGFFGWLVWELNG